MKKVFLTSVAANILDKIAELIDYKNNKLTVAFIANAADLYADKWFVEKDKDKFIELGFKIIDVDISNEKYLDISKKLQTSDMIFVAGGNVFYLLQEMKKNGVDALIKTLVENGKIYIGSSAGSIVAGPDIEIVRNIDSPEDALDLTSYDGLNLIDYSVIPHCDNVKFKDKIDKIMADNEDYKYPIIRINDSQAVFIEGNNLSFFETHS